MPRCYNTCEHFKGKCFPIYRIICTICVLPLAQNQYVINFD